jgi:PAS domain S-box-containing protein
MPDYLDRPKICKPFMPQSFSILNSQTASSLTIKQSMWLHAFATNIHAGVLITDENRNIIFTNPQLCSILHLQQQPEAFYGHYIMEVFNAANAVFANLNDVTNIINQQADSKEAGSKHQINLTDGKFLSCDYNPVFFEEKIIGHIWLFADETENIKKNDAVKQEKQFYENILNAIPVDVTVLTPSLEYKYINPQAEPDEIVRKWMIGKNDTEYFLQKNKDHSLAEKRKHFFDTAVADKKSNEWEESFINEKGETETFIRKLSPVFDDAHNLKMMIGFGININERKKMEARMQQSEKKYRDIFTYSQAIICTHDTTGKILTVNPSLCEAGGYAAEEIVGKNLADFLSAEDRQKFDEVYLSEINKNKKLHGLFSILRKSGEKAYLLYQNYMVEEANEQPYIVSFSQDMTDRIIAEKKLKEAQKITEDLVKSKEKFLSDMSHEIRTPMNGILGISSLLQKTVLSNEQKFYLNIIEESAKKLLGIINQIQDVSDPSYESEIVPSPSDIPAETEEDQSAPGSITHFSTPEQSVMIEEKEPVIKIERPVRTELGKLRVLLAEDNDINQVLVKNILKHWGFESKAVASGDMVVSLLEEEDFDLVLMDIQMPHKSGIEVTQEIRLLNNPVKRNIPIIALTAFTIKGEEKKYRAAGMDAFLTKPFKENDLYEAITKVLEIKKNEDPAQLVQPALSAATITVSENPDVILANVPAEEMYEETTSVKLYDLSYLRGIQGSSPDLVNKLVEIFIRTVPPSAKEMIYASKSKDWDNVSKLAHKIKSSINTMGIHSLKGDVKFVEEAAAQKDELHVVASKILKIDNIVSIAAQQLQEELNTQFSISNN